MRINPVLTIALAGALLGSAAPVIASDYGGVVLGRRTGPDGALLIAPVPDGARQRGYVVVSPSTPARGDVRYGRTLPSRPRL